MNMTKASIIVVSFLLHGKRDDILHFGQMNLYKCIHFKMCVLQLQLQLGKF